MRTTNSEALKIWKIRQRDRRALEKLAIKAGCSASLLQKLIAGCYQGVPKEPIRQRLSKVVGMSEDELFPYAD